MDGIVMMFSQESKFGFISNSDNKSYYTHMTRVLMRKHEDRELIKGEPVVFDVRTGKNGKKEAYNVRPLWRVTE